MSGLLCVILSPLHELIYFSQHYEVDTINPIFQMRKLRHKEVEFLSHVYINIIWYKWNSNPDHISQ